MRGRGRAVEAEARPQEILVRRQPPRDLRPQERPVRQELDGEVEPPRVVHEVEEPRVDEDLSAGQVEEEGARLPELGHDPKDFLRRKLPSLGSGEIAVEVVAVQAADVAAEGDLEARVERDTLGVRPVLDRFHEGVRPFGDRLIRAPEGLGSGHERPA